MRIRVSSCTLVLALLALCTPAWAAKVKICHVPPGNPSNFHTITIDDNAVQAHLAHGDLLGACAAHCDQLCDDGNPCTIDACDANEHCLATHPPVNCDDGNACTIDSCDPTDGCHSTQKVCQDTNLCTANICDPLTGSCAFPSVICPAGQACNASNGNCEGSSNPCIPNPCQNGGTCDPGCLLPSCAGPYTCACPAGWTGPNCEADINECSFGVCGDNTISCENTPGSFICHCDPLCGDGVTCGACG